ncbi:Fur family transcriptional regulator [Streptomyces sp. NPDC005708]|uniref:Fur family transcriptional regulator n=2 Tax=Streptomyces TaxID=1883 RepID=UPI0033FE661E
MRSPKVATSAEIIMNRTPRTTVDAPTTTVDPMADAAIRLQRAQLRVTAPRMAVLAAVEELGGHSDVDSIRNRAQGVLGRLSLQATYDVLRVLTEAALLRCTHIAGHRARYEVDRHDNHHHFVCRTCGCVVDVECVIGAAPCLEPQLPPTYLIGEAAVTFWGTCPDCSARAEGDGPANDLPEGPATG